MPFGVNNCCEGVCAGEYCTSKFTYTSLAVISVLGVSLIGAGAVLLDADDPQEHDWHVVAGTSCVTIGGCALIGTICTLAARLWNTGKSSFVDSNYVARTYTPIKDNNLG